MLSPQKEKERIFTRLQEIEHAINPADDPFLFRLDHPLCLERDSLIKRFYEYRSYENWFHSRHPSILVSMYLTGATTLQVRINTAVAFNLR